jgi:hypothetical protein
VARICLSSLLALAALGGAVVVYFHPLARYGWAANPAGGTIFASALGLLLVVGPLRRRASALGSWGVRALLACTIMNGAPLGAALLSPVLVPSHYSYPRFPPGWSEARLRAVATAIVLREANSAEPPPTSLAELVEWIASNVSKEEPYIDYDKKSIRDAWRSEIVLVVEDGALVGVGSAGPNRTWENGRGDDIVVKLEEVK